MLVCRVVSCQALGEIPYLRGFVLRQESGGTSIHRIVSYNTCVFPDELLQPEVRRSSEPDFGAID